MSRRWQKRQGHTSPSLADEMRARYGDRTRRSHLTVVPPTDDEEEPWTESLFAALLAICCGSLVAFAWWAVARWLGVL